MAIKGMFFNAVKDGDVYDRSYNADDFSIYLDKIVGNGVFPNPSTSLQARATSGMNVAIGAGQAWIDGHKIIVTADEVLTLDPADTLLDRIDRIVVYCDYTTREMGIDILKGEKAASPVAPAITRNNNRYEMSLATIRVKKQVTAITDSVITDTRADSNVCGWAAGVIQQVDTSTLFLQWQTAYEDYYADIKQQLDDFIETLTEELSVNTYVVEYNKTGTLPGSSVTPTILLDMPGYTREEGDIISIYLNGFRLSPDEFYLSGNIATITVLQGLSSVDSHYEVEVLKTRIAINHI